MSDRTQILGPVKVELGRDEMNLLKKIAAALERAVVYPPAPEALTCSEQHLHHDEQTLHRVSGALELSGLSRAATNSAINSMLNSGILFREREPAKESDIQPVSTQDAVDALYAAGMTQAGAWEIVGHLTRKNIRFHRDDS